MNASISDKQKMRGPGRPSTGSDPMVGFRLSKERIKAIEEWAAKRKVSKSDAFRMLLDIGLENSQKS